MANVVNLSEFLHERPKSKPIVYAYIATNMPDHDGYIKVGYTVRDEEVRVGEQAHTIGAKTRILFTESAERDDGTSFTDDDVHKVLRRKGFRQLFDTEGDHNEWFQCSEDDVHAAINEVRLRRSFSGNRSLSFPMRAEQQRAVDLTADYFVRAKIEDPDRPPKFLWNAKMRFGKTFASYELAKKLGYKRVLVLTFKPAVESAWQEDLMQHIDFDGWQFVSNKEARFDELKLDQQFASCDPDRPIVVFGSFQDLLGTTAAGGIKAKNEFIHATNWDLVIFDEYHFGAWRENARNLFEKFDEENNDFDLEKYQKEEAGNAINESFLPITADHYLYLSGTPFRALNSGEFLEDQIFNWTYSDEQSAKEKWQGPEPNPYAALPKMVMLTYKVPDSITSVAINEGFDSFDINEFFRAEPAERGKPETARFVYEDYVQKWLDLIQGKYLPTDGLRLGNERPPMPFSDATLLNVLSHTLWFLPNVASCYAMANLLGQAQNKVAFGHYKVVVCAGIHAGIGLDALKPVKEAMTDRPLETRTITLSCGKLTTGVTIRPWTGVFMLRNLQSPETYFQTAFRVQSPWTMKDDSGKQVILKPECYIFDFALERALRQISDYAVNLKTSDNSHESKVREMIDFLPVLAFDGSSMRRVDAQDILDITYAGTSATLLAKRWQTALLVHVDNDTLKRLQEDPELLNALMSIEGFRALGTDVETIINRSEKVKKAKKEKGDTMTPSEKKELTEEEKAAKSLRKQVQENLLKLAARIPAFMYLTDFREQTIQDVITHIEPELFQKVTGLTVKIFEKMCSIGLFDSDNMNQGIFGFRKYENASLSYTGIDKHAGEAVGGWDTVLRREEYESLYSQQQAKMTDFTAIMVPQEPAKETKDEGRKEPVKPVQKAAQTVQMPSADETTKRALLATIESVKKGDTVHHKSFGTGMIRKIDRVNNRIDVEFLYNGRTVIKPFVFPDAFVQGFLTV